MNIFKITKAVLITTLSTVLLCLYPLNSSALPLVWDNGVWGDTWQAQQTSPSDSDGDGVSDTKDVFPLDNAEWGDFDNDNLGDNSDIDDDNDGIDDFPDPDDDNDGLTDTYEANLGTDPLNTDTDDDGDADGDEVASGRNPLVNEPAVIMVILGSD